jgi:galactonate dehydratase
MKHWRDLPDFAPDNAPRVRDSEAIADLRAWCIREPDSKRQYTVVRLTTGNGSIGFGEGSAATRSEIADAKSTVLGRSPSESEFIRHRLASLPAMEAAISNAMLDLTARAAGVPVYQYLGGPTP